jgi:hypothetical protein
VPGTGLDDGGECLAADALLQRSRGLACFGDGRGQALEREVADRGVSLEDPAQRSPSELRVA